MVVHFHLPTETKGSGAEDGRLPEDQPDRRDDQQGAHANWSARRGPSGKRTGWSPDPLPDSPASSCCSYLQIPVVMHNKKFSLPTETKEIGAQDGRLPEDQPDRRDDQKGAHANWSAHRGPSGKRTGWSPDPLNGQPRFLLLFLLANSHRHA